nr:hypothetical protein [uncultured Psychroserpens sp.]
MKTIKLLSILTIAFLSLTVVSCSSDDSSGGSSCANLIDQAVQGSFRGTAFVSPAGFYKVLTFGETTTIRCDIYVKESLDSDCFFPTFEGDQDTILFSISSLEAQTITLEEFGNNTLNFNRITIGDDGSITEIELAECGTIEITSYNADTGILQGTVVAEGQFGSTVNGNFTLLLCDD